MSPKNSPWFVFRENSLATLRLFCFCYAGGGASAFRNWKNHLPSNVEVVAIQLPGRESRFSESLYTDWKTLAKAISQEFTSVLDKPYAIFGHSLGAILGFEVIRLLRKMRLRQPSLFFPSGRQAPQISGRDPKIHHLPKEQFIEGVRKYNGIQEEIIANKELMELVLPRLRADFQLSETYSYQEEAPLVCPIIAFHGRQDPNVKAEELIAWEKQTNTSFQHHLFPGDHFFIHNQEKAVLLVIGQQLKQLSV